MKPINTQIKKYICPISISIAIAVLLIIPICKESINTGDTISCGISDIILKEDYLDNGTTTTEPSNSNTDGGSEEILTISTTTIPTAKTTTYETKEEVDVSEYNICNVPDVPDFKSWTNYINCVSRTSPQWRVLTGENTYTDEDGFRRCENDYLGAMGSYYTTTLGDRFRITTTDNNVFTVMICDFKANKDTNTTHQYTNANNCIIEFYTDNSLCSSVRCSGSASSLPELSGKIIKIERI